MIENHKDYIFDDTLYIICNKYSTKQLQQLYQDYQQKNERFNKVFIFSLFNFAADEDIKMPSISVYIYTYYFDVVKNIQFDLSGADGKSYLDKAQNGKNQKNKLNETFDGQNGNDGEPGQNGGSFYLNSVIYSNFEKVEFYLRGGNGGKGQDGGDGADGINGKDAQKDQVDQKNKDYICFIEPVGKIGRQIVENLMTFNSTLLVTLRSEGTPGQIGGNAGSGGFGGEKGQDGILQISSSFRGRINYKNQITVDGQNGQPGIPGKGGNNGKNYEGQYEGVFLFGESRDLDTKQQSYHSQQIANIGTGVFGATSGVKLTPKLMKVAPSICSKIASFLEAQLGAELVMKLMGSGGSMLAFQAIFSSIQSAANSEKGFIKKGYLDNGKQPDGSIIKLNRKNKQDQNILKIQREYINKQFADFVNENKLLFKNQIPYLNIYDKLFREQ